MTGKKCKCCGKFHKISEVMKMPEGKMHGNQIYRQECAGLLYWNCSCESTMAVKVKEIK
jgi:hypothetical protein